MRMETAAKFLLRLIVNNYIGLIVGTIFTPALLYLWKWFNGKEQEVKGHRRKFILGSGLFGLILATLFVAAAERVSPSGAPKRSGPELHCSVQHAMIMSAYGATPVAVFYAVKIVNSGSASVVWKWNLVVRLTSGQVLSADASEDSATETVVDPNTKQMVTFQNSEYLPNTLLENPVPTGAGRKGWLTFQFTKATEQDLGRIGNTFVLKFEDCNGNATFVTNVMTESGALIAGSS